MTVVGDDELGWASGDNDSAAVVIHTFHSILHNIDKYLLEEDRVKTDWAGFVSEVELNAYVSRQAQVLEERQTFIHFFA